MLNVTGNYDVTIDGRSAGTVSVSQNGLMTTFESACRRASPEVLRLAVISGGQTIPIGVMIPDGSVLKLKKNMSKNAMASIGLTSVEGAVLIRAGETQPQPVSPPQFIEPPAAAAPIVQNPPLLENIKPIAPAPAPAEPALDDFSIQEPQQETAENQNKAPLPEQFHTPDTELPEIQAGLNQAAAPSEIAENQAEVPVPEQFHTLDNERVNEPEQKEPLEDFNLPETNEMKSVPITLPPENSQAESPAAKENEERDMKQDSDAGDTGWRHIEDPSALFSDPEIAEISRSAAGALTMEDGDTTLLAVPISPKRPFPMMPVFCFGSSEMIGDAHYIVFKIEKGNLTV